MKTKKEIEKAIEDCRKVRMSNRKKKSLCPLYPGEPICFECTFSSVIEWVTGKQIEDILKPSIKLGRSRDTVSFQEDAVC